MAFEKEKSDDSGAGVSAIGIEPICYLTEEISNQLLAKISGIQNTSRLAMKKVLPTCCKNGFSTTDRWYIY